MCGIIGYVGEGEAAPVLLDGLKRLEYRGYDSAGIAVFTPEGVRTVKARGRIACLVEKLKHESPLSGGCGHRPHALGDARRAERPQRASAHERPRDARPQRHCGKLPGVKGRTRGRGRLVFERDGHGGPSRDARPFLRGRPGRGDRADGPRPSRVPTRFASYFRTARANCTQSGATARS